MSIMDEQKQSATSGTHKKPSQAVPPSNGKKAKMIVRIAVALTVAAAVGIAWFIYASGREETDDAYVDGHISNISSKVSGTVTKVLVEENQTVTANQPLVELDPRDYQVVVDEDRAALEIAQHQANAAQSKIGQSSLSAQGQTTQANGDMSTGQAEIEAAQAALMQARDGVRSAQARLEELSAQVEYAKADFDRYDAVYKDKAVTRQQYDKARTNFDMAKAQQQQARESLEQAKKQELQARANVHSAMAHLDRSKGTVTTAQAAVKQEQIDREQYAGAVATVKRDQVALAQAELQLSYTKINAPVDGRIGKKAVEIGQRVEPGQALLSLVHDEYWVSANYKETQVGRMHIGQPAEVKIDAFPGQVFKGRVESLSPASGAKFSLLPPDNATGNFTKVVQRIPVKIVLDKATLGSFASRITPGMSCLVTVFVKQ